jgi:hypothetical protein
MNKLIFILVTVLLMGCDIPVKPDFVSNGKEYMVEKNCVKSHYETKWTYHWGYNMFSGKHEWHWGDDTESVCDEYRLDTVEINIKKKYYSKK